jgi:hypothetical protein
MKELDTASQMNFDMHPQGPPFSLNAPASVVKAVGAVDMVDTVDAVEKVEAVERMTAMKVRAPIAKLTAIHEMHAGSGNALSREETMEETTE